MSESSFTFNPYAQDDGRINLGVDLREGTIAAGHGVVIEPIPEPEPELEEEDEGQAPAPGGDDAQTSAPNEVEGQGAAPVETDPGAAASGDPAPAAEPDTKVLTRGGTKQQPRTGPKPRTK